jgi:integrase
VLAESESPLAFFTKGGVALPLNGAEGSNRAPSSQLQIRALNDLDAINCWLKEYEGKATTYRSYRKESERLLMWCVAQKNKPLSSLQRADFDEYALFLADPTPKERWCAAKGAPRGSDRWRPFTGPLSPSAVGTAFAILDSMVTYLVDANYLKFNPLSLIRRKVSHQSKVDWYNVNGVERILEDDEWAAILSELEMMPSETRHDCDEKMRLRFMIALLFLLGLRIDELAKHGFSSFRFVNQRWWFYLVGKGDKGAKIPVNDELLSEVDVFRKHFALVPLRECVDNTPLVPSWQHPRGLGARQMSHLLKTLASKAALRFEEKSKQAEKLRRFSPHWLRHLSASMQDRQGIRFTHIKANLRHASDDTTRRYVHSHDTERHEELSRLKLFG